MKAYFFVITPLNYLYAHQASLDRRFKIEEKHLIVLSDYNRSLRQFKAIIDEKQWHSVTYPWYGKNKKTKNKLASILSEIFNFISFSLIIRRIKKNDSLVFWGNYNHKYLKYLNGGKVAVYVLDDGFSTINILRKKENDEQIKEGEKSFSFYTVFNVESTKFKIERHRFENITIKKYATFLPDHIYFLGQPLVYNNAISSKHYIDSVNLIFNHYSKQGKKCFYLPHRSTNKDYIPKSWYTLDFDFPIEYIHVLESHKSPGYFMTFYSTGVYNIKQLYNLENDQCVFWELPNDWIHEQYRNDIDSIYTHLKFNNFQVRKIKELTSDLND